MANTCRLDLLHPSLQWKRVAICVEYLGNGNWKRHHQWQYPIGLLKEGDVQQQHAALNAIFARQRDGEDSVVVMFELQSNGNWLRVASVERLPLDGSLPPPVQWMTIRQDEIVG